MELGRLTGDGPRLVVGRAGGRRQGLWRVIVPLKGDQDALDSGRPVVLRGQ